MRSHAARGAIAGLIVGLFFGILLQFVSGRTPAGNRVIMMDLVARAAGVGGIIFGWLYHLFDCAVMGAIFGAIFGPKVVDARSGLRSGAFYGLGWWALGGLILMPFYVGMSVFSPQTLGPVRPVGFQSFFGHLIFGLGVGGVYYALQKRAKGRGIFEGRRETELEHEIRRKAG